MKDRARNCTQDATPLQERTPLKPVPPWKVFLGLALGLILLAVAARGIELGQVLAGLARANPTWIAVAFLSVLLTTAAKIGRWQGLFPRTRQPDLLRLGKALLVGQLFNALLPARIGDVVRAYTVGTEEGISRVMVLGTVAAEKAFDVLFLLLCGGLAAIVVPLPPWLGLPLAGGTVGGVLLFLLALFGPEQSLPEWVERGIHRLPWESGTWLVGVSQRILVGLAALRESQMASVACAWSAAIWMLAAGTNYLLFLAFKLRLPFVAALSLLVLLHVGVAPPSSPARLGVFHALTILGLEAFGVDRSSGLAYAAVLHAIVYLPQIVPGIVILGLNRRRAQ
jgi:uncharacterized protein (TIRG00374 family)